MESKRPVRCSKRLLELSAAQLRQEASSVKKAKTAPHQSAQRQPAQPASADRVRRPLPKHAHIPAPTLENLILSSIPKACFRSAEVNEDRILREHCHRGACWSDDVPIIELDVSHADLAERTKNTASEIAAAQVKMRKMRNMPADACSAVYVDKNGVPLLAVWADHISDHEHNGKLVKYQQTKSASWGRTVKDVGLAQKRNRYRRYGLRAENTQRVMQAAQTLHSVLQPKCAPSDIRHNPDEQVLLYDVNNEVDFRRFGINYTSGCERTGVSHLVHAWHAQGHPNEPMTPSSDMTRTATSALTLLWYYDSMRPIDLQINTMFATSFPDQYGKYKTVSDAGKFIDADASVWLGRAILHKLQVELHRDALDPTGMPAASFPAGRYSGGEMYLPDLGVKLAYRPGDVVIFLAADLYHAVGEWHPVGTVDEDGVTPGRISHVYFTPRASFDDLIDKPPGWARRTAAGRFADSSVKYDKLRRDNAKMGETEGVLAHA